MSLSNPVSYPAQLYRLVITVSFSRRGQWTAPFRRVGLYNAPHYSIQQSHRIAQQDNKNRLDLPPLSVRDARAP